MTTYFQGVSKMYYFGGCTGHPSFQKSPGSRNCHALHALLCKDRSHLYKLPCQFQGIAWSLGKNSEGSWHLLGIWDGGFEPSVRFGAWGIYWVWGLRFKGINLKFSVALRVQGPKGANVAAR